MSYVLVQEDDAFAAANGCQPVLATLPYRWPFALDLLKAQYDAIPDKRLLEFQTKYMSTAPTIRIDILGEGYILTVRDLTERTYEPKTRTNSTFFQSGPGKHRDRCEQSLRGLLSRESPFRFASFAR